jgi:hypothetical protein
MVFTAKEGVGTFMCYLFSNGRWGKIFARVAFVLWDTGTQVLGEPEKTTVTRKI